MFEFDSGSEGPYINWHANGRKDGTAAAKTFSLKDGDEREDVTHSVHVGVHARREQVTAAEEHCAPRRAPQCTEQALLNALRCHLKDIGFAWASRMGSDVKSSSAS